MIRRILSLICVSLAPVGIGNEFFDELLIFFLLGGFVVIELVFFEAFEL